MNLNSPRNGLVQVTIVSAINRLIGRSLTIAWHWISVGDLTVVVLNSYLSLRSAVTSKGDRLWHYLILSQFPTSRNIGFNINRNSLIGLTSNLVSLNRVAIAINVYHVRCLVVSRVSNVNSNVFLTISNGYCINLSLRNSITSMNWCIIFSPVCSICGPVSVSYITSYFINGCITEDLSSLRNLLSSLAWFMNLNSPRNGLVQVTIVSAINRLIGRSLTIAWHWISVGDLTVVVLNSYLSLRSAVTSKGDRLWHYLILSQFPTSRNIGFNINRNSLIGLTSNLVSLNRVAIAINVYHVRCLVVSRVSNMNGLILSIVRYRHFSN